MESVLHTLNGILEAMQQIERNFHKDSGSRKTSSYIETRLNRLDQLWAEFKLNHEKLVSYGQTENAYFVENQFEKSRSYYDTLRKVISSCLAEEKNPPGTSTALHEPQKASGMPITPLTASPSPAEQAAELLRRQRALFRGFSRYTNTFKVEEIKVKWELEDKLKRMHMKWNEIESYHTQIDAILEGSDSEYEDEFLCYEESFEALSKSLNERLASTSHLHNSTPKLEVPIFSGSYTQWATFKDLFSESIHDNHLLTNCQKMQHLKGKLKGEPERLVQHLHISSENYETAWELLNHRYNNPQVLFAKHIELFLNQSSAAKQSSKDLKRIYDTSMENIHAIQNLGIDTKTWGPMLAHIICKKLDPETAVDFRETRKAPREIPTLQELMNFLENKFISLEPLSKKEKETTTLPQLTKFHSSQSNNKFFSRGSKSFQNRNCRFNYGKSGEREFSSAACTLTCPYCKNNHLIYRCDDFKKLSSEDKLSAVTKLGMCQNCLLSHEVGQCRSKRVCRACDGKHNSMLHDAFKALNQSSISVTSTNSFPKHLPSTNTDHKANHVASESEEILLTTLSLRVRSVDGTYVTLRALLDQGSQISLISENAVQLLGLPRKSYNASVSGIGEGSKQSRGIVSIDAESIYGDYKFTTRALVIPRVVNNLPNMSFPKQTWVHLGHIQLGDPDYNVSKPIDLLLDASVYSEILMGGLIRGPPGSPIAQQTRLGWILSGSVKNFKCNVVLNEMPDLSQYWELEEVSEVHSDLSASDRYCEDLYQATTKRLSNGSYEVAIPMKPYFERDLGSSKEKAIAQFYNIENKLSNNEVFAESYKQFMRDYEELGHMKRVQGLNNISCYLPHHGIFRADSTTTKLRVVFNASSKTSTGKSLNDLMERGPNLQKDLQTLILTWRHHKYVITADIEKMFRTIYVREADQSLQSIVWRSSFKEPIGVYSLTTLTYGTKSAPYLAMRTLKQIAMDYSKTNKYPLAIRSLQESFYMDDLLEGGETINETRDIQQQVISILSEAGMNIRKWSSNTPELTKDLPEEIIDPPLNFKSGDSKKTLGISWKSSTDTFTYQDKFKDIKDDDKLTKRQLLSHISKIFDPLGWISPLTVKAKLLFQRTWLEAKDVWDEPVNEELTKEWHLMKSDFQNLHQLEIPRHLGNKNNGYQLHGFCDASEKAYACVIYIVTINDKGESTSRLIAAKTKLAPVKTKLSLPRLELSGALLLCRLMERVLNTFPEKDINMFAWTDSMIVLGWIHGGVNKWKQFVANRVQSILKVIPATKWRHVRSEDNAADCATRGLSITQLADHSLWWEGPQWVHNFDPNRLCTEIYQSPSIDAKKISVNIALDHSKNNLILRLLNNYESIQRVAIIVGWLLRFIMWLRNKKINKQSYLTISEINHSYNLIIKTVQGFEFSEEIERLSKNKPLRGGSKLLGLNPFIDKQDGLLKVGGRLKNSLLKQSVKTPIILSSHSRLTKLIIDQAHQITLHGGPSLTLAYTRDRFWIISGLRTVKRELNKCVRCKRHSDYSKPQLLADLPESRVTPSPRAFSRTGIDFTGHFDIKANKGRGVRTLKGYVCVFVCMSTKAVHLELVSDLSTPGFIAALSRFCSRRGTPSHIYSDNGTNFVGADRLLKKEYDAILQSINPDVINRTSDLHIQWHFNAPAYPSAGGLWEAAVRRMKYHLKRVVGEQKLTYEEFITVLHQIEACLNSRPLIALTESPDDIYLTPGHFLIGGSLLSRPPPDPEHVNLTNRWQMVQSINKDIWKAWSSDYLHQLQVRSKWKTQSKNIVVDDIVIIKEENLPPGKWLMGRVVDVHPGRDGCVRVASVKTKNGIIRRPCLKLSVLPVKENQDAVQGNDDDDVPKQNPLKQKRATKAGLCHLITMTLMLFLAVLSPAQGSTSYNITYFDQNQSIYFEKIANLNLIRDEWKLVVYFNMSSYWIGLNNINNYVSHLNQYLTSSSTQLPPQYKGIVDQLQQEILEIEHYNTILTNNQIGKRQKRGLVNGVGYLANALFGVLDDSFAKQYEKDIEKISQNEGHLNLLLKNQTSVLEAQYNIMKRNEDIMNSNFKSITQQMESMRHRIRQIQMEQTSELNLLSLSFTANIIINSIRRIQDSLIDVLTDISHGHLDMNLLPPEQLEKQVSIISSHLRGELTLAVNKQSLYELYKQMKASARVGENFLIIQIKIPLINKEALELDSVISLPHPNHVVRFITPFIAFNMQKDIFILMTTEDIHSCMHTSINRMLCPYDKPIFELPLTKAICNTSINNKEKLCNTEALTCQERWVKLQNNNMWLFTCCNECSLRIFCADSEIQMETLTGNGLLTVGQGCVVKSNDFSIYGHNNYLSQVIMEGDLPAIPEFSVLNKIVNSSVIAQFTPDNHEEEWSNIKTQIEDIKAQTNVSLNVHDIHQYTLMYAILGLLILAGVCYCIMRRRRKAQRAATVPQLTAAVGSSALVGGPKASQQHTVSDEQVRVRVPVYLNSEQ